MRMNIATNGDDFRREIENVRNELHHGSFR
jgi:hypothetical protein